MKFWERNPSAKYRAEGLNLSQMSRINDEDTGSRSTLLIAALAFVAVGSLGYIGLQTITSTSEVKYVYTAAPPEGTAHQMMMALKVPHDREQEKARLALLNDDTGMEIKSLAKVERLINPDAPVEQIETVAVEQVAEVAPPALPTPVLTEVEVVEAPELIEIEEAVEEDVVELAAVVAPEPPAVSCYRELQDAAAEATIFFGLGSTQITASDISTLQQIGRDVMDCPEVTVHVTGHSDTTGNDLANLNLSWQRADNVVTALTQIGIDTSRFEPVGFGARAPLSQGDASDEDLNRRVEFVILRKTQ